MRCVNYWNADHPASSQVLTDDPDAEGSVRWRCVVCGATGVRPAKDVPLLVSPDDRQPPPKPPADPKAPAVWDLVKFDMEARDATGLRRYGTRLKPGNGRDALQDAYEEALDLVVYLRQVIYERSGR
jgi:hypothetical protein